MVMLIYLRGEVEPPAKEPDPRPRLFSSHGHLVSGDGTRVSRRRLGRFAYQCCRKWWDLPLDQTSRCLVGSYERFLTGDGSWEAFLSSASRLSDAAVAGERPLINTWAFQWSLTPFGIACLVQDLAWVTAYHHHRDRIEELERNATEDDRLAWGFVGHDFPEFNASADAVRSPLPPLLREVVGNPFCPVCFDPSWRTPPVVALTHAAHDNRLPPCGTLENGHLLTLADALEEAGCTDAAILGHLRGSGPHVRGCWAVDLLLGKS
jgi:hypothetical protein